jgi:hypothetical protein
VNLKRDKSSGALLISPSKIDKELNDLKAKVARLELLVERILESSGLKESISNAD